MLLNAFAWDEPALGSAPPGRAAVPLLLCALFFLGDLGDKNLKKEPPELLHA
jgi:hypothetical protein